MRRRSSRLTRFIRNRTGIHRIPPLRSLSHVKRRGLRGSETAAKGGYGLYQIKLDSHLLPTFDASSATPLYNQTLFNATVPNGFHQVQLINAGNRDTTLDVNYVSLCELY
jgi:hypothetical protein